MNVLQNLTELYNHLSAESTYRDVAGGILANLEAASEATIYDLAEMTNSSRTTIWRMVQKMGYQNFTEFRHALRQAVRNYTYYNRIIPANKVTEDHDIIANLTCQVNEAATAAGTLSPEELHKMAASLAAVGQISFYFPYRSSAITSFQQNLFMAGKQTGTYCLLPDMLENAAQLEAASIVFCATIEHAEAQDMTRVFKLLKERKVDVALVSRNTSRYAEYVDWYLFPETPDGAIFSDLVFSDIYFLALSEIFRKYYIK